MASVSALFATCDVAVLRDSQTVDCVSVEFAIAVDLRCMRLFSAAMVFARCCKSLAGPFTLDCAAFVWCFRAVDCVPALASASNCWMIGEGTGSERMVWMAPRSCGALLLHRLNAIW